MARASLEGDLGGIVRRLVAAKDVLRRGAVTDAIFFDAEAYRRENEDVADSVGAGEIRSFYDHYVRYGKWEGRRFALRHWGLSERDAGRLFQAAAELEARLDALWCLGVVGELGHRLVNAGGEQLVKPIGPWKDKLDRGPWTTELPWWARRGGWFMVRVQLAPVRAPIAIRPLGDDGEPVGEPIAVFCKATTPVRRLIRLPPGATSLGIALLDTRVRSQPVRLRLRPVPESRVETLLLRRIRHHHLRHVGRTDDLIRESLWRQGASDGRAMIDVLWEAYEATFPHPEPHGGYADWIDQVEQPHLDAIDRQLEARLAAMRRPPRISVLVPVYDPAVSHLKQCIASVREQSYPHWELCMVNDASRSSHVRRLLDEAAAADDRIVVTHRADNGHISRASNDALAMASGDFVALLDHDDRLGRHALLQVAEAIVARDDVRLVYSDEDKLLEDGRRDQPHFKPELDPDLLLGQNYVGHLMVARAALVREVGGFRTGYEGSQDHDLALRLVERLEPHQVAHVPWVLYHWRMTMGSTATSSEAKPYTAEAGIRAVRDALDRRDRDAHIEHAAQHHCYRVEPALPDPAPRVSVIIPTRDAHPLISRCVDSLLERTDHPDFEVIVVDNGSRDRQALRYLERIAADRRVRVRRDDRPFNFSALNNAAVEEAEGELVCLLNNDTEVTDGGWLRQLAAQAVRPEIGCVGPKLLFPDGTIQHAGVLLGLHGLAGHPYRLMSGDHVGYYGRLTIPHSVSAVTAACLVVKRRVYREVGGLDEGLAVAFNDVDFCLKVRDLGRRNLLVPHVSLVHHESATRGLDQDPVRRKRFLGEVARVKERWRDRIAADPCYSPHLSLDHDDYSLRIGG